MEAAQRVVLDKRNARASRVEGRPPAEWSFTLGAGAETPELEQAEQANLLRPHSRLDRDPFLTRDPTHLAVMLNIPLDASREASINIHGPQIVAKPRNIEG